jgi:hypothetical protein
VSSTTKNFRWGVIAHSEQGAAHVRSGLPNQDAVHQEVAPDGKPPIVLTVADGHGSPRSFRSDIGSRFAVEVAATACSHFLHGIGAAAPSVVKNAAEQQLPRQIIATWKQRVADHFNANPFSPAEAELLPPERYLVAYGATILIAAITDSFHVYFQLGDGEIIAVSDAGEVSRPIPNDATLIANETMSLCMENPLPALRFRFQYFPETPPALVLLSTDGYPNSFQSEEDFFKVGTDLLEILRTDGCGAVERDLPGWLRDASDKGSGDDATLGILYRQGTVLDEAVETPAVGDASPESSSEANEDKSLLTDQQPSSCCLGRMLLAPVTLLGSVLMAPASVFKRKPADEGTCPATKTIESTTPEETPHE